MPSTAVSAALTLNKSTPVEDGSITLDGQGRPADLVAPPTMAAPAPLVVVLHGYASNAEEVDRFLGAVDEAGARGMYALLPEGTAEPSGRQFWDGAVACCNFTGTPVDDVTYISGLIDEAIAARPIDPARVYVIGHSNGGFLAYRLACDLADKITAVAVFAGAEDATGATCTPSQPVSVLHLHGTSDSGVAYVGGRFDAVFTGAEETVSRWAARDGCGTALADGGSFDLDASIYGAETKARVYQDCPDGINVQLDVIDGGEHSPPLDHAVVGTHVLDWLLAHSR